LKWEIPDRILHDCPEGVEEGLKTLLEKRIPLPKERERVSINVRPLSKKIRLP
jgi:hypothetical protein